jgi:plasmid replication initiation protein
MELELNYQVYKDNHLIDALQKYSYSSVELKLIAHLISHITEYDNQFDEKHINAKEFFNMNKINTKYINEFCHKLLRKTFEVINRKNGNVVILAWFTDLEYSDSTLTYRFNDKLKPYLLDMKKSKYFTNYTYKYIHNLSSSYSIQIYELLKEFENKKGRKIMFEDFERILNIPNSYNAKKVESRILEKAKSELREHCDIYFEYSLDLRNRKINRIDFSIKENRIVKQR